MYFAQASQKICMKDVYAFRSMKLYFVCFVCRGAYRSSRTPRSPCPWRRRTRAATLMTSNTAFSQVRPTTSRATRAAGTDASPTRPPTSLTSTTPMTSRGGSPRPCGRASSTPTRSISPSTSVSFSFFVNLLGFTVDIKKEF